MSRHFGRDAKIQCHGRSLRQRVGA
jgi:hypothetical protein